MQELMFQVQGALKAWCLHSPAQRCRKPRFISCAKPSQQGTWCTSPVSLAAISAVLKEGMACISSPWRVTGTTIILGWQQTVQDFSFSIVTPAILKKRPESTSCDIHLPQSLQFGKVSICKAQATAKFPKGSKMAADGFIHTRHMTNVQQSRDFTLSR